ncbi:hypothetical protein CFIMG_006914RA [Ceratocystis fimbriata CBS 114723]|uniref:Uncharacterized protein n=1 Tax=Ceratocystis fimbriata CBS 114723 TaxID=1035309 RepID=A0A2C5WUV8_9PEZI|nr:hypothetical protein CFIMG_006914RA [Ceratocystis fimbriata CBS 114723]
MAPPAFTYGQPSQQPNQQQKQSQTSQKYSQSHSNAPTPRFHAASFIPPGYPINASYNGQPSSMLLTNPTPFRAPDARQFRASQLPELPSVSGSANARRVMEDVVSSSPVDRVPESDLGIGDSEDSDAEARASVGVVRRNKTQLDDLVDDTSQDVDLPVRKKRRVSISEESVASMSCDIRASLGVAEDLMIDEDGPEEAVYSAARRSGTLLQAEIFSGSVSGRSSDDGTQRLDLNIVDNGGLDYSRSNTGGVSNSGSLAGSDIDARYPLSNLSTPTRELSTSPPPQPTFQRAPRFRPASQSTQSTDPEAVTMLFSPPPPRATKKGTSTYRPHGLAAAMQGWLAHVRGLTGDEEQLRIVQARVTRRMVLAEAIRENGRHSASAEVRVRVMLAGIGKGIAPGRVISIAPPTWWADIDGIEWLVASDWRVLDTVGDEVSISEELECGAPQP